MWNRSRNSRRQGAGRSRRRRRGLHVLIPVLLVLSLLVPLVPVVQASGGNATPSEHQVSAPPAQFGDRRSEEDIFLPEEGFGEPLYQSVLEGWLREGITPAPPEFELVVRGADWTNISDPRHVQVGDASATNMMQRYADLWEQSQALTRQDPVRYPVNQNIRNLTTAYNQPEVAQTYQRLGDRSGPVALWGGRSRLHRVGGRSPADGAVQHHDGILPHSRQAFLHPARDTGKWRVAVP